MGIDVTVLRVFTDPDGNFGDKLAVLQARTVVPEFRQRVAAELGYPATVFVEPPTARSTTAQARTHTPRTELPFAGHPALGAAWWLREQGTPVCRLQLRAGIVQVRYLADLTAITARSEWVPALAIHRLDSLDDLAAAEPGDYFDGAAHYLWAWSDEEHGALRSRVFAEALGTPGADATGFAAVQMTDHLSRDLTITQDNGSMIQTTWSAEGWAQLAGRVVSDGAMQVV